MLISGVRPAPIVDRRGTEVPNGYSLADRDQDFPHGRVIIVSAFLGPFASAELNQALITGGWFAAGAPRPPAGYQRTVIGGRGITLTDSAPRFTLDFEMLYRPIAAPR